MGVLKRPSPCLCDACNGMSGLSEPRVTGISDRLVKRIPTLAARWAAGALACRMLRASADRSEFPGLPWRRSSRNLSSLPKSNFTVVKMVDFSYKPSSAIPEDAV